ncbi:sulfotransferase domain-containing protein [Rheinheimera maricola]|uniref:Sulfotransferase domain-containing protein n=1 Tax=Rheinheimera maricola TaxID=2793282 RepID=A0ABS7X677_9GAMM|nr:sulfotransferase domain-containing protein [Rheinheimera maricola]MBZ9610317.1 sulfotransferase domain-containing protein [Rheinheimera maricola]
MNKDLELISTEGKKYVVSVPLSHLHFPSAYVFAFAKSGSTLLDRLVRDYCKEIGVPSFSLFGSAFNLGVNPGHIDKDAKQAFTALGTVYTGFRHYPRNFDLDLREANCIWLTRDPRDMLVSLYFSIAKSHVVKQGDNARFKEREIVNSMDIDTFVLSRASSYIKNFNMYRNKLPINKTKIVRYEDVIYDKESLLSLLVEHLALPTNVDALIKVAKKHDVIPDSEQVSDHVRQVHPGNYLVKLKQDTIGILNKELSTFLDYFDYR